MEKVEKDFTYCSGVSIVDFEQVNAYCDASKLLHLKSLMPDGNKKVTVA